MPPVHMLRFSHLAFILIDLPPPNLSSLVRQALIAQGGHPRVTLTISSYNAALVMFESNAAREDAVQLASYLGYEHVVNLECHKETPNRFHF